MNNNVICPSCGQRKVTEGQFCINCGYNFNNVQPQQNNVTTNAVTNNPSNGMGIAGLVISIISFICCCGSLSWLSLIFSIIGMNYAKKNNDVGKGISLAGLIISIIGLLIIILYIIFVVVVAGSTYSTINSVI